jgi:hypothetical protein
VNDAHERFRLNLDTFLSTCPPSELYLLALGLAQELDRRVHPARGSAYILAADLLADRRNDALPRPPPE